MIKRTLLALLLLAHAAVAQVAMIGTAEIQDYTPGRPFANFALMARPFGEVATPYKTMGEVGGIPPERYDPATGYPRGDFAACVDAADYPSGVYTYKYDGKAKITFRDGARNQTATTVEIDGNGGPVVWLVTGTDPTDHFRNLRIYPPGYSDATGTFTKEFLANYVTSVIRVMDWMEPNYEVAPPVWELRSRPGQIQTRRDRGVALEYIGELATRTGKDIWVTVPLTAPPAYWRNMAQVLRDTTPASCHIYLEVSNEVWNFSFPQAKAAFAMAKADTTLVGDNDYARMQELLLGKLSAAAVEFRGVLGAERVRPVYACQGAVPWLAQEAARRHEQHYGAGDLRRWLFAFSYADYYWPAWELEVGDPAPTVAQLLGSMYARVRDNTPTAQGNKWMATQYVALAKQYGVDKVFTYEGGPAISDTVVNTQDGRRWVGNHDQHYALQFDPGLGSLMVDAYKQAGAAGVWGYGLFNGPVGPWLDGRYGYWAMQQRNGQPTPKTQAMFAMAGASPPPVTPPVVVVPPTTGPTTVPATKPTNISAVTIKRPDVTLRFEATTQQTITVEQK